MTGATQLFVKVTAETLDAKANEISTAFPEVPQAPLPPCMLVIAAQGAEAIRESRDHLAGVIKAGKAEADRLAACLRAAAAAYKTVDEQNQARLAQTMSDTGTGTPSTEAASVTPDLPPSAPAPIGQCPAPPDTELSVDWRVAARQINSGDHGSSMNEFASALYGLSDKLTERAKAFSLSNTHWEGGAAEAAEGGLRRHESWLYDVATKARELAAQAQSFVSTHVTERGIHPDEADAESVNQMTLQEQIDLYPKFQQASDDSRSRYAKGVTFPSVAADSPPDGAYPAVPVRASDLPPSSPSASGGPGGGSPGGGSAGGGSAGGAPGGGSPAGLPDGEPSVSPASANPDASKSQSGSPAGGGGSPSGAGGSPSGAGGGLPGGIGGAPDLPPLDDPSLGPAGTGGGGGGSGSGGGGGGGVPSAPLGPAVGAETVASSPTGARGPAGAGPVGVPGGGGTGGMMGGMGGMGHGGQSGQGTEKRRNPNLSPDEDLYVEDRAHTEGVIGHRPVRRRNSGEGKDEK